jgi:hypothetical protein
MTLILGAPWANYVLPVKSLVSCTPGGTPRVRGRFAIGNEMGFHRHSIRRIEEDVLFCLVRNRQGDPVPLSRH